jgi:hypothetical protein
MDIKQDDLAERNERCPGDALADTPKDQAFERCRKPAEQGRRGEQHYAPKHHQPSAKTRHDPTDERQGDRRRQHVECCHPGDLVLCGGKGPLHLRKDGRHRKSGGIHDHGGYDHGGLHHQPLSGRQR